MKKFLVGLLTVALAASMLVGCGKKEEKTKTDNSLKDVQSKKELVLGLDSSFPPMGFTDKKDNIVGFDIDLAKEVTKRMGIKLKLQPINWNSKEQELNTEKVDCLWNGVTYSKARAKEMLCSESYMDNHQVLIVPANSKIKSLKDITKDTEVGIQSGSTAADAADSVKELKKKESKADIQENIQRPLKKYNFFTSRFFSAVDIEIDKKPDIIIITYAKKVKHTKIDPYTEAIQIYGRFRNTYYDKDELPFNSITHITDIATDNKKALTDDEVDLTLKEYKTTYDSLRKREEELYGVRRTAIQCNCSRVKYNDFIDENGELNYFSVDNLYNEERVKRHYESSEALINAYNSTNHFNSKLINETNLIDNDFRLQLRKCKSSKDKRRSIITKLVYLHEIKMESYKIDEFKQDMKQEEINKDETGEWIIDVYSYFGEEYIRKNEYGCNQKMKNDLNRAKAKEKKSTPEVFQKVYNTFDIDTKIEKNEAKKRLEKIYEMFDIQKYDKAIQSDIEIYYNVKSYNNDKPATYKILNKKMEIG